MVVDVVVVVAVDPPASTRNPASASILPLVALKTLSQMKNLADSFQASLRRLWRKAFPRRSLGSGSEEVEVRSEKDGCEDGNGVKVMNVTEIAFLPRIFPFWVAIHYRVDGSGFTPLPALWTAYLTFRLSGTSPDYEAILL